MAKRFKTLSDAEIVKALASIENYGCDPARKPMLAALFTLLANLGLRVSEALALKWSDVDWERGEVTITTLKSQGRSGQRAQRVTDTLPLDQKTIAALLAWGETGARQHPRIFPIGRNVAYNIFQRLLHYACIRPVKLHALRHSAVTRWLKQTKDIRFAMLMARHSNLATTSQYTHCDDLAEMFQTVTHVGREP